MKKVKKSYSRSFSVFNITKEDLEYIEGVLMKLQPEDYKIEIIKAKRAINSKGDSRGEIDEVLVRNYE